MINYGASDRQDLGQELEAKETSFPRNARICRITIPCVQMIRQSPVTNVYPCHDIFYQAWLFLQRTCSTDDSYTTYNRDSDRY
jgi:hypothetical protein